MMDNQLTDALLRLRTKIDDEVKPRVEQFLAIARHNQVPGCVHVTPSDVRLDPYHGRLLCSACTEMAVEAGHYYGAAERVCFVCGRASGPMIPFTITVDVGDGKQLSTTPIAYTAMCHDGAIESDVMFVA